MKKATIFALFLIFSLLLCGCSASSGENVIFGTFYNITVNGSGAKKSIQNSEALLSNLEKELSTNLEQSDVAKINASMENVPIKVGNSTVELFLFAKKMCELTENAYNPAIFPLVELWKFAPSNYSMQAPSSIPKLEDITPYLSFCRLDNFILDETNQTITKTNKNAKLDFGGIAKGYAADKVALEVKSGSDALINIGGNIKALGKEKNIGISHPREKNSIFATVTLQNSSIATSGDYERFYFFEGQRYHHILDKNGYPSGYNQPNPITSVTVVGESAGICDALSTAFFILDVEKSKEILKALGYSALIIYETDYVTLGDANFEITAEYKK